MSIEGLSEKMKRGSLHRADSVQTLAAEIAGEWAATSKPGPFSASAGKKRATKRSFESLSDEQLDKVIDGAQAEINRRHYIDVYADDGEPDVEAETIATIPGEAPAGSNPYVDAAWDAMTS